MKIVINSNVHYKEPLKLLMNSIINSGFTNFNDIIIVTSENNEDTEPVLINLSNIIDIITDEKVVLVKVKINNYDYSGFNILNKYKNHPLIKSDKYFYLLDTTKVEFGFYNKLLKFEDIDNDMIIMTPIPNSNIILFGSDIIDLYGDKYNVNLTKEQAIDIEFSREVVINGIEYVGFSKFPKVKYIHNRIYIKYDDIYKSGYKRKIFYYPDFGVYKYIQWGNNGDIKGKLKKNYSKKPYNK